MNNQNINSNKFNLNWSASFSYIKTNVMIQNSSMLSSILQSVVILKVVLSVIIQSVIFYSLYVKCHYVKAGSAKANGREPKTGLGRAFNFK